MGHGAPGRLLAAARTWLRDRPDFIHYDWNYSYFLTRSAALSVFLGMGLVAELWLLRRLTKCCIVWSFHNIESHERLHPRVERWVQRRFVRQCSWIRVMSRASVARAAIYLGVPPEAFRVVPLGSYAGWYPDRVSRSTAREELTLAPGDRVLLTIGAVRRYKGIPELLEAFQQVQNPRLRLIVAGPCAVGGLADEIRAGASRDPRVMLLMSYVPDDRIQVLLRAADAVILPYQRVESSSSAALAMAFGRAVIAPAIGGLPELLAQQEELLYEGDGLSGAIERFATADAETLEAAGRRNLTAARANGWRAFAGLFGAAPAGDMVADSTGLIESGPREAGIA